jgi:hypothetical protein
VQIEVKIAILNRSLPRRIIFKDAKEKVIIFDSNLIKDNETKDSA